VLDFSKTKLVKTYYVVQIKDVSGRIWWKMAYERVVVGNG
jgi:hypothetical protein